MDLIFRKGTPSEVKRQFYKALPWVLLCVLVTIGPFFLGRSNAYDIGWSPTPSWFDWGLWSCGALIGWRGTSTALRNEVRSTQVIGRALVAAIVGLVLVFAAQQWRLEAANVFNRETHVQRTHIAKLEQYKSSSYRRDWFGRCKVQLEILNSIGSRKTICFESNLFSAIPSGSAPLCDGQEVLLGGRVSALGFAVDRIEPVTECAP